LPYSPILTRNLVNLPFSHGNSICSNIKIFSINEIPPTPKKREKFSFSNFLLEKKFTKERKNMDITKDSQKMGKSQNKEQKGER